MKKTKISIKRGWKKDNWIGRKIAGRSIISQIGRRNSIGFSPRKWGRSQWGILSNSEIICIIANGRWTRWILETYGGIANLKDLARLLNSKIAIWMDFKPWGIIIIIWINDTS
mgnify:CR=1 FL=1